jgi:MFS family permease
VTDRLLTRPFVFAWLANMAQGMAFTMFLHFPGFLKGLGAGEVEIGLIVGLTAVASIAVRPSVGRAMDQRGRRPVILFGNVVNVAVLALYLTVGELGAWLYAVRITHGFAEALLFTALFTYGADQVPATRRTEGIALFGISGILPIALGGVLGDIILARWDFDVFFVVVLGFGILSLLLSLPLPESHKPGAGGEQPQRFLASVTQRNLLPLWWVTLVFSLALTAYFTFLKTFVIDTGIGSVGLFFSAYAATAIGLRLFAAWLPDRVGPKRVLYPALGSMVLGFVVLASADGSGAIAVAGVLCGAGHGYAFPIVMGMVVSRAAEADRGSAMAIFTGLFDVGALLGGPAFGAIIRFGSYSSMFLAAGGWMLVGGIIYAYLDRSNPVAPTGMRRTRLAGTSMIPGESAAVLLDDDPPAGVTTND